MVGISPDLLFIGVYWATQGCSGPISVSILMDHYWRDLGDLVSLVSGITPLEAAIEGIRSPDHQPRGPGDLV